MVIDGRRIAWSGTRWGRAASGSLALLLLLSGPRPLAAGAPTPYAARGGLDLAVAAADAWAADAQLIYLENDDVVDERGAAARWGYLFYSASLDRSRAYSILNGKIVQAENLEMKFQSPPLARDWMDSGAALEVADRQAGREFCQRHQGQLSVMLLMRGAFQEDPDPTTWTLVYTAPHVAPLFVMVDAGQGRVRRTWRG